MRASSFCVAGAGPMPMIRGGTPAVAAPTIRARGVRPCFFAAASLATSSAHAPSLTPDALPAVTVPSGFTIALQLRERLERRRPRMLVAIDDDRDRPSSARPARRRSPAPARRSPARPARASASAARTRPGRRARLPYSAATFSAVSGIESMPYFAFISGLTKRQPIVVSSIFAARENALSALASTNGARLMLSTPPAIASPASPAHDRPRRERQRVETRAAQPVDGRGRHVGRQSGEQRRHPRDVAVVLARPGWRSRRTPRRRRPSRRSDGGRSAPGSGSAPRSSVRTVGERAAVAADRRADGVADEGVDHVGSLRSVIASSVRTGAQCASAARGASRARAFVATEAAISAACRRPASPCRASARSFPAGRRALRPSRRSST